ncbi:Phosphoribosylformylglycinamidine cyclo-ligase [uncultured archaeon]|nr:Phosphoribosylformylglycinamidine cyclo-ligase [uncultured archaeon]
MKPTYAQSGVDVQAVKAAQARINALIGSTSNAHTPDFLAGHYAGVFEAGWQKLTMHCDGVGSKLLVAQALDRHDTVGIDALAMNANDLICVGSKPIVGVDYIALSKMDEGLLEQVMKGLVAGCKEAGVALIGGETAILPDMIAGDSSKNNPARADYDLAMTVVGTLEGEPLTGKSMKAGDTLIGLSSSGLHSNGYTLARKLLPVSEWGEEMLVPTRLYVKAVLEMLSASPSSIHGIAHITGGAFSKLSRIGAHAGTGFELDALPKPEGLFAELEKKVGEPYELYRTFNMGVGMVLACEKGTEEAVMKTAKKYKLGASVVGHVISKPGVTLVRGGKRISLL